MYYDQRGFTVRFEWGAHGVAALAPISDVVIIVDVLSFSTSVDIAVARGATVFPYKGTAEGASAYASEVGAILAARGRTDHGYTLSPASLLAVRPGERIVLPSPNGSTLSLHGYPGLTMAGCLRNARAVAAEARQRGDTIAVVAAGERWREDFSLRPGYEDLIGAGAIISYLDGRMSPEAVAARGAFESVQQQLVQLLRQCSSGKELIERGFAEDVGLAAEMNVSAAAPILHERAYVNAANVGGAGLS